MSSHVSDKPDTDFDSLLPPLTLDRRGFLVTSLAGGFAVAAGAVQAQTAIQTPTQGLVAGEVKIPVRDGDLPAYRAAPEGKRNAPVVLVIQEIFGVHEYIKDVCRRLAHLGYYAVAPEMFARQGDPSQIKDIPTLQREIVSKVSDEQVMADLDAVVAWAGQQGGDAKRLGITGFCWGGRITWLYAAHNPNLKAGVAWYGRLVGDTDPLHPAHPVDVAARLHAPVLGLYGGQDAGIPVTSINTMKDALGKGSPAAQASSFLLYKDAPHAFHADYRPSYRKAEAEAGWQRMQEWFAKSLR
ncbi:dienelactone hydrolase family protein [Orrella dioscoreae]|uniref:Dienelactone hydrolase family n=1 Tax=Orrella dioscoreae TaxID=1851544 RepID=A0A1C3K0W5_9BURK|nr:dienelactone hydrolase family protein [Orrella dioscoreae]SBT25045.1 Dienelactone hydrolase family [Orrella dioscoreae]SOE47397.1 Dienelactone hydrolase family [Orrella dioscoreae]